MCSDICPLISVIIPVYKVEKYIVKCVESILAQTYRNLEIILVDDGSPDNCPGICDEFAALDTRVRVIHKDNSGVSDARNIGLNVAKGEYIGFIDSDDWIAPNMYETLLASIIKYDADIAVCDYQICNYMNNYSREGGAMPNELKDRCLNKEQLIFEVLQPYGGFFTVIWNKLYHRSVFEEIRFPSGKHVEDEFILHKIVMASKRTICIPDVLYYYLQRDDSFIHQNFSADYMDYGYALLDRYYMVKRLGYQQWKDHTVSRLSFEMEKWISHYSEDDKIKRKCDDLRKKTVFLLFEPMAWHSYNWKGKVFAKLSFVFPHIGNMLRHFVYRK